MSCWQCGQILRRREEPEGVIAQELYDAEWEMFEAGAHIPECSHFRQPTKIQRFDAAIGEIIIALAIGVGALLFLYELIFDLRDCSPLC